MIKIQRSDVVLVHYPLVSYGLTETKLRPALVIQCDENNRRLEDVILLPLTSKTDKKLEKTHIFIAKDTPEGKQAGIKLDSLIKAETILTIPKSFVCKKIGHLPSPTMEKVAQCLIASLGLNA